MDNSAKVDAVLAHHGVLGMKWGVRRERAAAATAQREKENYKRDREILRARERRPEFKKQYKDAKVTYKKATLEKGKREAYKTLLDVKDKRLKNLNTAQRNTHDEQRLINLIENIKFLYAHD